LINHVARNLLVVPPPYPSAGVASGLPTNAQFCTASSYSRTGGRGAAMMEASLAVAAGTAVARRPRTDPGV